MNIDAMEEAGRLAQTISFSYEDHYHVQEKRKMFQALFERYLSPVDPSGSMEPYYAIILLWRKNPAEFDQMVREMKDHRLIPA